MINTKGPQTNLTLRDYVFIWMWIAVLLVVVAIYFGILETFAIFIVMMIFARFKENIKTKLRNRNMLGERITKETFPKKIQD